MSEKVKLTPQQKLAVESKGGALLVSAAAGSGKTKVLVERLMKQICEEGADIDSFLIITYTNAAAAEMRGRIIDAISQRLGQEPGNIRLHRQLERCYRAKICTIHSFCTDVIRQNAHILGINPDFRVIDEAEAGIIMQRVLDEVLEEKYELLSESFALLVDTMSSGRNDKRLQELILEVFSKMRTNPDPIGWANAQKTVFSPEEGIDASETIWGKELIEYGRRSALYWKKTVEGMLEEIRAEDAFAAKYEKSVSVTYNCILNFLASLDKSWEDIRLASVIDFPRVGGIAGHENVKNLRKACKNDFAKTAKYFQHSSEELMEDIRKLRPVIAELFDTAESFYNAYAAEKNRLGVIDFGDQEHLALSVLVDENGCRTEAAEELSAGFTEIMVDEYQDVNALQEKIFSAVSRNGKNIFMVGDVKQSIYRFRQAEPEIFIEKYMRLPSADEVSGDEDRKVVLSTNFRSRKGILEGINFIFKNIMSRELGEMDYTPSEYLYAGLEFPENGGGEMELCVVDMSGTEEDESGEKPEKLKLEAKAVSEKILSLKGRLDISDGSGGLRKADWGDFTILLRSVKNKAAEYAAALQAKGIPVSVDKAEDFFAANEITSMVSFLAVIDNPRQDIPLISAMRSFIFGFTADELAEIRAKDKRGDFYDALLKAAESSKRCSDFINTLSSLNAMASEMTVEALLWKIYSMTGAIAIVGAMDDGESRQERLITLVELARKYESDGYMGLFGFVDYLRTLAESGGVPGSAKENANAVKIMSIHKSKGLEYPVVILADTAKRFNRSDSQAPLPIHQKLGPGPEVTDLKRRIRYPSIARQAVARRINLEMLAEEMRVLYVALTRAREKLIVFSSYANAGKLLAKLSGNLSLPLQPKMLESASSVGEWLLYTALLRKEVQQKLSGDIEFSVSAPDDGFKWDFEIISADAYEAMEEEEAEAEETAEIGDDTEIRKILSFSYPHSKAETVPSKLTATQLKGRFTDAETGEEAAFSVPVSHAPLRRPDFEKRRKPLTGTEKGTALHLVMQFIDYGKCTSLEAIAAETARLEKCGIITKKQAEAVNIEKILTMFTSPLGKRIMSAEKLRREFKFSMLVPAERFYDGLNGEEILLQGVIDCMIEEDDGIVIIDYKTDYVTENTMLARAEYYRGQVETYAIAMEEIIGKPVKEKVLYFFETDSMVSL